MFYELFAIKKREDEQELAYPLVREGGGSFMLESLLKQLGQELDMEDLISSPEDRHYLLPFVDNLDVEVVELENNYYLLKGIIGPRPQENGEAFLLRVMEANLFGTGTRGAAIGLKEDEKLLTLSMQLEYNSSYKNFKEKLEDFISVLDFWRKEALKHE